MSTRLLSQNHALVGLPDLLRLMLRRDRLFLPAWMVGFALFALYVVVAIPVAYGDEADMRATADLFAVPMSRVLIGPAYGFENPSFEQFVTNGYGLYFLLLAALMSILVLIRHTRADEQTERAELLRSSVVGRHATLTAAVLIAVGANLASAATVVAVLLAVGGYAVEGSLLFGIGIAVTGIAFAGVAAVTAQLSEFSRAASGLAGMVLGAAFVVRAGGDLAAVGGSALSWFSPLAWAQQTAPFVLNRWWPLFLPLVLAVATFAVGFALSAFRDFGASYFRARLGSSQAPSWWGNAWGWSWRQQRSLAIVWTLSLAVSALAFGGFAQALLSEELPEIFRQIFTSDDLLAGYLAYMVTFMAYFVSAFAVMAVQSLRNEETSTRLEPILALPLTRTRWLLTQTTTTTLIAVVMLLVVGLALGTGAAFVTSDWTLVVELGLAQLSYLPAVVLIMATAVLFFGILPRLIPATWLLIALSVFLGSFGSMLDLPRLVMRLSPFMHLAEMPIEDFDLTAAASLTGIAIVGLIVGMFGLRQRDVSGG